MKGQSIWHLSGQCLHVDVEQGKRALIYVRYIQSYARKSRISSYLRYNSNLKKLIRKSQKLRNKLLRQINNRKIQNGRSNMVKFILCTVDTYLCNDNIILFDIFLVVDDKRIGNKWTFQTLNMHKDYGYIVYNQVINTFHRIGRDAKFRRKLALTNTFYIRPRVLFVLMFYYVCVMYYNMYNNIASSTKVLWGACARSCVYTYDLYIIW